MLKEINLSLSSACGAKCVYCPTDRGEANDSSNMSMETLRKVVDEVSSKEFSENHHVESFHLGENGDGLINPHFVEMARYIRKNLPDVSIKFITNFQRLHAKKTRTLLEENLVNVFVCNIDGATEQTYETVKGLRMDQTLKNMEDFLKIREELNSSASLNVNILTLHTYIHTIKREFGFYPINLKSPEKFLEVPDDLGETQKYLKRVLDPKKDVIFNSGVIAWAERDAINTSDLNYDEYDCPNLNKIKTIAHISPDGYWYACCLDSKNELKLGNVHVNSLQEIYKSEGRKKLINLLTERRFGEIKGPCQTVNCCQWLKVHNPHNKYLHKFKNLIRRINPVRTSVEVR
ncbi:MAG: radical SAM protein [Bacteriovoracaceae bacterium]|nr:radical SAM protein [Bacteriovoracaceae bacterium]